ncbi:Collectin-46 [Platysternon megacephalum]|uniref:Collectin-46 n=1 Tax=Platysternon megacephalum TaxID=55544 RepID=A0A4D9EKL3_9SAUR|nr:Collectin-46 [Platysternon megacephalum]
MGPAGESYHHFAIARQALQLSVYGDERNKGAVENRIRGHRSTGLTMHLCQPFKALVLAMALMMASAFDALQRQVTALEKNIQTLQADVSRHQKFFSLRWVKSVGKKTFMSTGTKDSFENGKSLCAKAGGALACPHNHAENTALREILKDSERAYLGMSDVQTEGKFLYLNGEPVTYTNWEMGEPNNNKNEDCVAMYDNGKWNDIDCSKSEMLIICKF